MIGDSGGLVDFPTGWTMVRLSDIVSINPALTAHLDDDLEVSFVPMKAVEAMSGRVDLSETRRAREVRKGYTSFYSGDVLWAKITPCMENGKVAVIRNLKNDVGFGSTEFHVLRPFARGVTAEWLFFFLTQQSVRQDARKHMTGSAGQLRVPTAYLADLIVPLPPRVEQRAIVVKIEALFSELDKGIEQLQTIKQQLKQYRQAVLKAAFEGKLTAAWRAERQAAGTRLTADELLEQIKEERKERYQQQLCEWEEAVADWEASEQRVSGLKKPRKPRRIKDVLALTGDELAGMPSLPYGWAWAKIGQLFDVYVGSTPSRDRAEYWGGSIRWVSSGEVAFRDIYDTQERITERGLASISARVHPPGSVLMAMIGEGKTRGQSAILRVAASHNQNTAAIRVGETCYLPEFLFYFLQWTYDQNRRIGSGNNQKALSQARVQELIIPVCSPTEQRQVVTLLETSLSLVDDMERALCEGLERAGTLRQSILRKAFEGHLLNDAELIMARDAPEYEPADKLLERIRVEKGLGEQPSGSRRSRRRSKPARLSGPRGSAADARSEAE